MIITMTAVGGHSDLLSVPLGIPADAYKISTGEHLVRQTAEPTKLRRCSLARLK